MKLNDYQEKNKGMVNQHVSGTSDEIEKDDNLAMNPAGESLIVQPSEPIFNSESNYEELVHDLQIKKL